MGKEKGGPVLIGLSFWGGETIVRESVALQKLRPREVFLPLSHRPGHAQVDCGEGDANINDKRVRHPRYCMGLPHPRCAVLPSLSWRGC